MRLVEVGRGRTSSAVSRAARARQPGQAAPRQVRAAARPARSVERSEPVANARLRDDERGRTRVGSSLRRRFATCTRRYCCASPDERSLHTSRKSCWCVSVRPACVRNARSSSHSVGVRWISSPSRVSTRAARVDHELADRHRPRRAVRSAPSRARRSCARTRAGAPRAERLGHVVVGARVEQRHLLRLRMPGGQHDDRRGGPLADLAAHLTPSMSGQAEVEHHQVGRSRRGEVDALRCPSRLSTSATSRSGRCARRVGSAARRRR